MRSFILRNQLWAYWTTLCTSLHLGTGVLYLGNVLWSESCWDYIYQWSTQLTSYTIVDTDMLSWYQWQVLFNRAVPMGKLKCASSTWELEGNCNWLYTLMLVLYLRSACRAPWKFTWRKLMLSLLQWHNYTWLVSNSPQFIVMMDWLVHGLEY